MQGNYCEPWVPWIQCGHDLTLERHLHRTDYWTFSTWPRDAFALHANAVDSQEPLLFEAEILWGAAARAFLGVDAWCTLDRILSNEIFCVLPEVPTEKKKKKRTDTLGLVEERSKRDMSRSIVVDNEEGRLVGFETIVFLAGKPRLSNTCDA